ncbi:MAG TPA: DUF1343 domain-containing protein [Burkholderiales bacterium]|nr:DUF1343 domain-containing protein [Burkholderiales bacterium]
MKHLFTFTIASILSLLIAANSSAQEVVNADARFDLYESMINQKHVAVFANNASIVESQNIISFLRTKKINIIKIFTPEHGFSGLSDAGASVASTTESGIKIVSLYGKKDRPDTQDLANVDIIVFDIQDVGVRYYTYISSLQKLMEAAAENNKPLIILDRANPNGFYVDGPVLESKYKSFVGMQNIPVVYGMTIGEYAKMLQGEQWLDLQPRQKARQLKLTVIPLANYTHQSKIQLSVRPSPNLPNMSAIYWYPSLGWFEGTKLSVGRGTAMPFQVLGHPEYQSDFSFTPQAVTGALNPPFKGKQCFGWDLQLPESTILAQINGQIQLKYLLQAYQEFPDKAHFFTPFFYKLAGTALLRQQVESGFSESAIRASWQPELTKFKLIRKKYLLYPEN